MECWLKVSLLLCLFGFLKEIRPSEPFIYEYLTGPWWNLTEEVVQQDVYPIAIYSYLANLAVVFLVTDLARYKPLIILMAVVGAAIYALLIWTSTLIYVQIVEVRHNYKYSVSKTIQLPILILIHNYFPAILVLYSTNLLNFRVHLSKGQINCVLVH